MTDHEAIGLARSWALSRGFVLHSECFAKFVSPEAEMPNLLYYDEFWPNRMGWWALYFSEADSLCDGGRPNQLLFVHDTSGRVEWPAMPAKRREWADRFRSWITRRSANRP